MNISDVEAFVALAETGSVNRAALRLNLTQPAVTRRIQSFEAAMHGAVLLDRRARPSVLTPEGRRVLEGCRRVLKAVTELRAAESSGPPSGDFRLGVAHGIAEVALARPIDRLRQAFKDVRPRITAHWTNWLIEQVRNGALDCAIGLVTDHHAIPSGVHSTSVGIEKIAVVTSRETKGGSKSRHRFCIRDLAGSEWILNPHGCGYRDALQRAFDHSGIPLRVVAEVFGHDLQLSLISRGAGFGLMPRRLVERSPYRRHVSILRLEDFDLQATVAMMSGGLLGRLAPVAELLQSQLSVCLDRNVKDAY